MIMVLSGEGKTDLGEIEYGTAIFKAGAMYMIVDKLIEQKYGYSVYETAKENIYYIHKTELKKKGKSIKVLPNKKRGIGTGFFFKNARVLAQVAKEKGAELAILFRDSDLSSKEEWKAKYEAMLNGFVAEKFEKGVAMLPRPKSESWLLCALQKKYKNCEQLEESPGNNESPNNLKSQLGECGLSHDEICEKIKNGEIDINQIDMSSFNIFKDRLLKVV